MRYICVDSCKDQIHINLTTSRVRQSFTRFVNLSILLSSKKKA